VEEKKAKIVGFKACERTAKDNVVYVLAGGSTLTSGERHNIFPVKAIIEIVMI